MLLKNMTHITGKKLSMTPELDSLTHWGLSITRSLI